MNERKLLSLTAWSLFLLTVIVSGCAERMMTGEEGVTMTEKPVMEENMVMKDSMKPAAEEAMIDDRADMKGESMGESDVHMMK